MKKICVLAVCLGMFIVGCSTMSQKDRETVEEVLDAIDTIETVDAAVAEDR